MREPTEINTHIPWILLLKDALLRLKDARLLCEKIGFHDVKGNCCFFKHQKLSNDHCPFQSDNRLLYRLIRAPQNRKEVSRA